MRLGTNPANATGRWRAARRAASGLAAGGRRAAGLLMAFLFGLAPLAMTHPASGQNGQGMSMPAGGSETGGSETGGSANASGGGPSTPPSLRSGGGQNGLPNHSAAGGNPGTAAGNLGNVTSGGNLPRNAGQEHRVYDLRPYTGYLSKHDHPEQAIVDWVLRETGSDVWFTPPFGFLSADRDQLSVYHTREMHQVVSGIVDRFVAGEKEPQVMSLRLMTVGNPNWRSQAHLLMQHVNVDSPGLQAWLLSKENAALVLNMLRTRTDVRQVQALDLVTHNGQTEKLSSTRGRNYVRNVKPAATGWPPYEPETGEIQEGYRLEISPLLSVDGNSLDCVIKAEIDQVDQLKRVEMELPLPNAEVYRTKIDVPQVVSWRLHERFRWPSDMVLLLSCGVVASPERPQSAVPMLNLEMLTGTTAGRADALMFIAFRGRASENLTTTPLVPQMAGGMASPNRGRY